MAKHSLGSDLIAYLKSRTLWINLALMVGISGIIVWALFMWMSYYTRHGQQLLLPNYLDKPIEFAQKDAKDRSFTIIVSDSVFIVGEEGGIIKQQNPPPESRVKEGRTIYVTTTKYGADQVAVSSLPRLYGEPFDLKKKELQIGYNLTLVKKGESHDPGPEGHIMAILYESDTIISSRSRKDKVTISKGSSLQVIVSSQEGASYPLPDLRCKRVAEARFQLETLRIILGDIEVMGATDEVEQAYVISQKPDFQSGRRIQSGDTISLVVSPLLPEDCQNASE